MTFTDDSADWSGRRGGRPVVPGIALGAPLRDAGAGEVWAGRIERIGADVTVRLVRLPADPSWRSDALTGAERLVGLRHPHLTSVTDAVLTPDGLAVVAEPVVGAVNLERLLGARGRLDPGEVVTVGLPVAQALAAAHEAGLAHGALSAAEILFESNGRPVLAGTGLAQLTDPEVSPATDVRDLAALLLDAMPDATGPDAAAVAVAVATALVDDPRRRPSAADLVAALVRSTSPLPVRMVGEGTPTAGATGPGSSGSADVVSPHSGHPGEGHASDHFYALDGFDLDASVHDFDYDFDDLLAGAGDRDGDAEDGDRGRGRGDRSDRGERGERGTADSGSVARDGRTAPSDPAELVGSLGSAGRGRGRLRGRGRPGRPAGRGTRRQAAPHRSGPGPVRAAYQGRRGGSSRFRWLLPVVGCTGLVIAVVAAVLVMGGSGEDAPAGPVATPTSETADGPTASPVNSGSPEQIWRGVLTELNTARSRAFEQADEAALAAADEVGSPVYESDVEAVRAMVARGGHSTPLVTEIVELEVRSETEDEVVLRVTESLAPYEFLDDSGEVLARDAGRPAETRDLTLTRTDGGWRVATSIAVPGG